MKKISYCATANIKSLPGVQKKIDQFLSAASKLGYCTEKRVSASGILGQIRFCASLFLVKTDYLILRCPLFTGLIFMFPLVCLRLKGTKIVIDVPTPIGISLLEFASDKRYPIAKRFVSVLLVLLNYPLSLLPANLVIQYSHEFFWFKPFRPHLLTSNGIDVQSVSIRKRIQKSDSTGYRFIFVSAMAFWHGGDRILRSLACYMRESCRKNIELVFVGDGPERMHLEALASNLGLSQKVTFTGMIQGAALDSVYDTCDAAIASMALYRKKLVVASELKIREYLCKGLPVIISANDPDLNNNPAFVYRVQNSSAMFDFASILKWLQNLSDPGLAPTIRRFAEINLDYKAKVIKILKLADGKGISV